MKGEVLLGDDTTLPVLGVGYLGIIPDGSSGAYTSSVLHVPGLRYNLLSVRELCKLGLSLEFEDCKLTVRDKQKKVLLETAVTTGLYKIPVSHSLISTTSLLALWHARFGHLNVDYLRKAAKMVEGLPTLGRQQDVCQSCIKGKQHRDAFPTQASRCATQPLELVHMDLCGPMQQISLGGSWYFMLLVDDFSRLTWVFFLHQKSEAFPSFSSWLVLVQKETGKLLKTIRADKGGEFTSNAMAQLCRDNGIKQEFTNTDTPLENGVVERKNRTVVEMARTMLAHKNVPRSLWAKAVSTVMHILNRSPTYSLAGVTPFEAYFSCKPDVLYFRVFGCDAYAHIPKNQRGKFDEKSKKMIFVGYNSVSTGYRLYECESDSISLSRDVVFDEHSHSEGVDSTIEMLGDPSDSFSQPLSLPSSNDDVHDDVLQEEYVSSHDVDIDTGSLDVSSRPLWARKTLEDSGVDVSTLDVEPFGGPR